MFLRKVFSQFFIAKLLYRKEAGSSFNLTVMVVIGQHLLSQCLAHLIICLC